MKTLCIFWPFLSCLLCQEAGALQSGALSSRHGPLQGMSWDAALTMDAALAHQQAVAALDILKRQEKAGVEAAQKAADHTFGVAVRAFQESTKSAMEISRMEAVAHEG
eukprot:CAMPEP_0194490950 /NCGR_PEP_ID=MMETSP0253-20130528/9996_1 /TAXON_ID=2966 /ORGANISM="Noctiluca scintillans" /LENGTH=107 /DNA_ID=CAMNT_0039331635 /DNA_START=11 /DNA_END=331 /DNA_ORIENTATION=-